MIKNNRHLAYIALSDSWEMSDIKRVFNFLPNECRFLGIDRDILRREYVLYLEHSNFPFVEESQVLPKLELIFSERNKFDFVKFTLDGKDFNFETYIRAFICALCGKKRYELKCCSCQYKKPPLCNCGAYDWRSMQDVHLHADWCNINR